MRYSFYFYDGYSYEKKIDTRNSTLDDLFEFLTDNQERWIKIKEDENDPRKVVIWSTWNLKEFVIWSTRNPKESIEEKLAYSEQYHEYGRKRFAEMPAIRISRENYEQLEQQWQEIRKRVSTYLIIREDDNGYVDILEKDEMSAEDITIMNREHKIYLNYIKRWDKYFKTHPEKYGRIWRSPADNLFESDFALYDPVDEQGID